MKRIDLMLVARFVAMSTGLLLAGYGAVRLLTDVPGTSLLRLALWLGGALVISDLVVSPLVIAIGVALRRWLPDRGRRYLQAFLIMAAIIALIAGPMIYLQASSPPQKALLQQEFGANLLTLLALAGLLSLFGYAAERLRDHRIRKASG